MLTYAFCHMKGVRRPTSAGSDGVCGLVEVVARTLINDPVERCRVRWPDVNHPLEGSHAAV
jgi:hypothetical protein